MTRLGRQGKRIETMTKDKKEKMPTLEKFVFDFRQRTVSTYAGRDFLSEKNIAKNCTAFGKPAKELTFATPT